MPPSWSERFELKPGRWVFIPTSESRTLGIIIKDEILKIWRSPDYMYQFLPGGHVAALQAHLTGRWFGRTDLQNCFGSINRSRVTRCLKQLKNYTVAREWANSSVVRLPNEPDRWFLPFGFVQSPVLAALCLSKSALGSCLRRLRQQRNLVITMYVDDIIVSSESYLDTASALQEISAAVARSGLEINRSKTTGPKNSISVFNMDIGHQSLSICAERMQTFRIALQGSVSDPCIAGIKAYVASVNPDQLGKVCTTLAAA